jgi:hypothetical protein
MAVDVVLLQMAQLAITLAVVVALVIAGLLCSVGCSSLLITARRHSVGGRVQAGSVADPLGPRHHGHVNSNATQINVVPVWRRDFTVHVLYL